MATARTLSPAQVLRLRLRAQGLLTRQRAGPGAGERVAQVVGHLCGVQAQDPNAAALSVRARAAVLTAADVEQARVDARCVVRTWLMRGTLHLVAADDVGWLLGLLGPIFARAGRGRRAELGLDDEACARGVRIVRDALAARGPLTRAELAERLAARGIQTAGQATIHLIGLAALEGVLCLGPERAGKPTYVLLADWLDADTPVRPEHAPAELARRYLAAYGPAAPEDFAAWSGLPLGQARSAWQEVAPLLTEVKLHTASLWLLKTGAARPDAGGAGSVRLLPAFDTYWMGYRSRALAIAPHYAKRILPGGLIHPALLVDGQARGRWRMQWREATITLSVEPFGPLPGGLERAVVREGQDIGRFLGADGARVVISDSC